MPIGMGALAIFLLVREGGGSFAIAGLAVATATLAGTVGAPTLGRLIDRVGQTRVLLASGALNAGALSVLALLAPARGASLFVLCAVYGASAPPIAASLRAMWVDLMPERGLLRRAYTLDSTAQEVIWIAGPPLVAALAAWYAPRAALLAMAVFCALGVLWFATAQVSRRWRPSTVRERRLLGPLVARPLRRVLLVILGIAFAWGSLEFAIAAFAQSSGVNPGILLALWAIGSVVGGLALAAVGWTAPPQRQLRILVVLTVLGLIALVVPVEPWTLGLLLVITGVVNAPVIATFYILIEQLAPRGMVTEAFTWVSTTFLIGISAGVASAGIGADVVGMSTVPEAIALRHMAVPVAAVSGITNLAAGMVAGSALDHAETMTQGSAMAGDLARLLARMLAGWSDAD
jgi:MFS family permease